MRVPSAPHVLALWEQGQQAGPGRAALALLACAHPDRPIAELAELPIGRRDRMLIDLRARLLGQGLHLRAACPACGEPVEAELATVPETAAVTADEHSVTTGEHSATFRLPGSDDIAASAASADPQATLLARCVREPRGPLPDALAAAVLTAMAELDPDADLSLALRCPACDHPWAAALDITPFFRAELSAWANRFAHEVDALARAYGWTEADILAMTPARRQLYLSRVSP